MCEHDLDTIQRLRERNKKLQSKLSSAERKLSVAREALRSILNHNWDPYKWHDSMDEARKALAAIGKGEYD